MLRRQSWRTFWKCYRSLDLVAAVGLTLAGNVTPVLDITTHQEPEPGLQARPEPIRGRAKHETLVEAFGTGFARLVCPPGGPGVVRHHGHTAALSLGDERAATRILVVLRPRAGLSLSGG